MVSPVLSEDFCRRQQQVESSEASSLKEIFGYGYGSIQVVSASVSWPRDAWEKMTFWWLSTEKPRNVIVYGHRNGSDDDDGSRNSGWNQSSTCRPSKRTSCGRTHRYL